MNAVAMVKRILGQRVIGYNFNPSETVIEDVCLMSDGSTEVRYRGFRTDAVTGGECTHDYGTRCPTVERVQEARP